MPDTLAVIFYRWRCHAWKASVRGALTKALGDVVRQEDANSRLRSELRQSERDAAQSQKDAALAKQEAESAIATIQKVLCSQTELTEQLEQYAEQAKQAHAAKALSDAEVQRLRKNEEAMRAALQAQLARKQVEVQEACALREDLTRSLSQRDEQVCSCPYTSCINGM